MTLQSVGICVSPGARCRGTGAGVGVDSTWEQKKLEARKMLENRAESQRPVYAVLGLSIE
jgi:hypothetical protein